MKRRFGFFQQFDGGSPFEREQMSNQRLSYSGCRNERWKKRWAFVRKDEDVVGVEGEGRYGAIRDGDKLAALLFRRLRDAHGFGRIRGEACYDCGVPFCHAA